MLKAVVNQIVQETLERIQLKLGVAPSSQDPKELETCIFTLALVIVGLERELKQGLPEPERYNVRAFIDQLSNRVAPQIEPNPFQPEPSQEGQGPVTSV